MRKRDLLLTLIIALIITTAITFNLPATTAQEKPTIAVQPLIIDTRNLKQIGETFSINITIANVQNLWGYQFQLRYNSSVINVTNYVGLDDRFTRDLPSEIGNNYTAVGRGTFDGDTVGIETTAPIPVDRVDFIVTGDGTANITLDPAYSELSDIMGVRILSLLVGGKFSNTEQLAIHDVGLTEATLSTTSGAPGDTITITATVANLGDFTENVTVTVEYNQTRNIQQQIGSPQTITDLAIDATSNQLTFTWDTAGVAEAVYEVTVEASITVDDKISDNTRIAGIVELTTGGGGGIPMEYIYIGVGIVIVVIALIAVFALRARK